ncbi:MAG: dTDP-4-dehydrorhamnose reductase [Methylophilus sp.]
MKKLLLTGINGQVGNALQVSLAGQFEVIGLTREQLDLTRPDEIRRVISELKPEIIINPAAYTAVDKAESEQALAYAINATAPQVFAEEAMKVGAVLIHFSTDYVYDGNKLTPYIESDKVNPLSIYGKSKLAGEDAIRKVGVPHLILRTSWVYSDYGKNFLKTILRLGAERDYLRIVSDQYGAPTSAYSIATGVVQLLNAWDASNLDHTGVYHFTNQGSASWYEFACQIVKEYEVLSGQNGLPKLKIKLENIAPISTSEYPTPAVRPINSRLDNTKLNDTFNVSLPLWQDALKVVMTHLFK